MDEDRRGGSKRQYGSVVAGFLGRFVGEQGLVPVEMYASAAGQHRRATGGTRTPRRIVAASLPSLVVRAEAEESPVAALFAPKVVTAMITE